MGFVLFSAAAAIGQSGTCPVLVERALQEMTNNCGGLDRNSACYGFNRVDATFTTPVDENAFSVPADRATLVTLETIRTAPFDLDLTRWGIAVLNVQANVPNSLPGQAVTFLLLGDVSLENAVPPDSAFTGSDPLTVNTQTGANLRSFPSLNANLVGSVPVNTALQADGRSADGEWLRVLYQTGPAWINRALVSASGDLAELAVIRSENRSPMQAFYFSAGLGKPSCNEVPPSTLVVQGPNNVMVDITANGADIRIGSTIALRQTEDGRMQLFVLAGSVQLGNLTVPAGFTVFITLDENGNAIGSWEGMRPLTADELLSFALLERIEGDFMHYQIQIPTQQDIQNTLRILAQTVGAGGQNGSPQVIVPGCEGLRATSPIGFAPFGSVTFYWDPLANAQNALYRISFYNAGGALLQAYETTGTNLGLDTSTLGEGNLFFWQVEAAVPGTALFCTTGQVTIARAPDPNAPVPIPGPFCGDGVCNPGERKAGCIVDCPIPICGDGFYEPIFEDCGKKYACYEENGEC